MIMVRLGTRWCIEHKQALRVLGVGSAAQAKAARQVRSLCTILCTTLYELCKKQQQLYKETEKIVHIVQCFWSLCTKLLLIVQHCNWCTTLQSVQSKQKDCTIYKKVYKGFDKYSILYCTTCCTMNPKPFLINCTTFDQTFCTIFVNAVVQVVQVVRIGTELQYCTNCTILYKIL